MTQLELIKREERIDNDNLFHIYLYSEGGWWRAYEWSAYLCTHMKTDNKNVLNPTHRNLKGSDNGIIFVGLQSLSFAKYFENFKIPDLTNGVIEIDVSNCLDKEKITLDNYHEILDNWKDEVPVKNNSLKDNNKVNDAKNNDGTNYNVNDLLKMIINYQLESKSLIESVHFISELKNIAFKLI